MVSDVTRKINKRKIVYTGLILLVVLGVLGFVLWRNVDTLPTPITAQEHESCLQGTSCVTCENGGCSQCGGDCVTCRCPGVPVGEVCDCVCGSCSASCLGADQQCRQGGTSWSNCACDNSECDCSNGAFCEEIKCDITCPCTPAACPSGWREGGAPPGWRGECLANPDCDGTEEDCSICEGERNCFRPEPTSQPALSSRMLYCFDGTNNCIELSTNPASPTRVTPPRPSTGGFVGMTQVTPPSESRGMYYDMYLQDITTGSLIFGYNGWNTNRFDTVTTSVISGRTYHVKGKDASLMRCIDNYWCAGDTNPWNGENCSEVHGYFTVTYPPVVELIEVEMDERITCRLPNGLPSRWSGSRSYGEIIVDVITNPSSATDSFTFNTTGFGYDPFSLTHSATPNEQSLLSGSYSVVQVIPAGWVQTRVRCLDDNGSSSTSDDIEVNPNNMNLRSGHRITCTFTNTKTSPLLSEEIENDNQSNSEVVTQVESEINAAVLAAYSPSMPNNPIDIAITVSDEDGWEDIQRVWLDFGTRLDQGFNTDFYCSGSQTNYLSIGDNREEGGIWSEAPSTECTPEECNTCYGLLDNPLYVILDYSNEVISDTEIRYVFTVLFKGGYPPGIQQMYGMALSNDLLFSGENDGGYLPRRTTDSTWLWGFDMRAPGGSITISHPDDSDRANQVRIQHSISDARSGVEVSGVRHLYSRYYWVERPSAIPPEDSTPVDRTQLTDPAEVWYNGSLSNGLESNRALSGQVVSDVYIPEDSIQAGDSVHASDMREDLACNQDDNMFANEFTVGIPWLKTLYGSVYGQGGMYDMLPNSTETLSQYWIGNGTTSREFGSGHPSIQEPRDDGWYSSNYSDNNINDVRVDNGYLSWYEELYSIALNSDWVDVNQEGNIYEFNSLAAQTVVSSPIMPDGFYRVVDASNQLSLPSITCRGRKVIFLPSPMSLYIEPDFKNAEEPELAPVTACLFIVESGEIVIGDGSDKNHPSSSADIVDAHFITDGGLSIEEDTSFPFPDRLEFIGSIFADVTNFQVRDMLWENNTLFPAVTVTYDPRALALFRDMLGQKVYSESECGIVRNATSCMNWADTSEPPEP